MSVNPIQKEKPHQRLMKRSPLTGALVEVGAQSSNPRVFLEFLPVVVLHILHGKSGDAREAVAALSGPEYDCSRSLLGSPTYDLLDIFVEPGIATAVLTAVLTDQVVVDDESVARGRAAEDVNLAAYDITDRCRLEPDGGDFDTFHGYSLMVGLELFRSNHQSNLGVPIGSMAQRPS